MFPLLPRSSRVALLLFATSLLTVSGFTLQSSGQAILSFTDASADPSSPFELILSIDAASDVGGLQVLVAFDNAALIPTDVSTSGLELEALIGPIEYAYPSYSFDPTFAPGVGQILWAAIFDTLPPFAGQFLPAGSNVTVARFEFLASPTFAGCTPIDFLGIGPTGGTFVVSRLTMPIAVTWTGGEVCSRLFRRGDVNDDSVVDIADAISLLVTLFVPGSPGLICADASDGNDDGRVDLSDSVAILNALFVAGSAPLPAPGASCGTDPTGDALGCAEGASCP
ncbi:MAG: hypothetical protein KDC38_02845 [Planctomycetes bacterium]|nr:hypothetical protein [Planctomycetota bacterium]